MILKKNNVDMNLLTQMNQDDDSKNVNLEKEV